MDLNATGSQSWPLTTGNNDDPTVTLGKPTNFFCNTVPDRCPTGPLAYVLPYVVLTFVGTITQTASGVNLFYDQLRQCVIDSVDWITAWYGTVLSANHVKGTNLPIIEFVSGGFRYCTRQRPAIPAAAGTYNFELSVALPASNSRLGNLLGNTSQLALLYQTSQIKLNIAALSVLQSFSPGATFGAITCRASAKLVPTTELVLGTPIENIQHQTVAGANSPQVQIKGFGTDTLFNNVQPKGGVVWLGELTAVNNQGGAITDCSQVTQFSFPWRGQQQTQHPQAIVSDLLNTMCGGRPQNLPLSIAGGDSEFSTYPYANSQSDSQTGSAATLLDLRGLLFWPLGVYGADDLSLTNLQTASNDQSYFLTLNASFGSTHLIQAMYAKAWQPDAINSWVGQITKGGSNSLAAYVLGSNYLKASAKQRIPAGRHQLTADQMTYQPYQFTF